MPLLLLLGVFTLGLGGASPGAHRQHAPFEHRLATHRAAHASLGLSHGRAVHLSCLLQASPFTSG